MATLREYVTGRTQKAVADEIGITTAYLSQLLSKRRQPSLAMMLRIQSATGGQVDLNSWVGASVDSGADSVSNRLTVVADAAPPSSEGVA